MRWAAVVLVGFASAAFGQASSIPPIPVVPASFVSGVPAASPSALPPSLTRAAVKAGLVDLSFVKVPQAVDLLFGEGLRTPHVIGPDVLADSREVSLRLVTKDDDELRRDVAEFVKSLGYVLTTRGGVDYVEKVSTDQATLANAYYVYQPHYRDADYLSRLVQPMFSGHFTANREVAASPDAKVAHDAPQGSAAALIDQKADELLFVGSDKEIEQLKALLPQVDTPVGSVAVKAWVYEVTESGENDSAFQMALSVLGGRVGASLNIGSVKDTDNAIRLNVGSFSAALSALNSDSRFKVLTSPNLRVRSGETGSLNVGESVPILGSVSFPSATAQALQNVVYADAGVIFQVKPTVKRDVIDLDLTEEISDFVNTTTGVNNSPTKNTRKVESAFSVSDGDVLLIGGLTQDKDSRVNSGLSFLPHWMDGHTAATGRTEILLLLQVSKI